MTNPFDWQCAYGRNKVTLGRGDHLTPGVVPKLKGSELPPNPVTTPMSRLRVKRQYPISPSESKSIPQILFRFAITKANRLSCQGVSDNDQMDSHYIRRC